MNSLTILLALVSQEAQRKPGMFEALLPIIIIFLIFYFILIRPQQKRLKAHRNFLSNLQKGEEVVTTGGLIGRVVGIAERVVTLDLGGNVRVKVVKDQIAGPYRERSEKQT